MAHGPVSLTEEAHSGIRAHHPTGMCPREGLWCTLLGTSPPSPLLIPFFPQVRQQTSIQAPGLTDREFYEQPMSAPQGASSCLRSCLQSHKARKCQLGLGEPSLPGSCCTVNWWGLRRMRRAVMGSNRAVGTCLSQKNEIAKTGSE